MNDQRKTKKQLLEELDRERERSLALQEVSKKVAAAHDTDEVLDLIVHEAARLVSACQASFTAKGAASTTSSPCFVRTE